MSKGRTSSLMQARERARASRLKVHAERERRDHLIEEAAASYFAAESDRDELREKIAAVERSMASSVLALRALGEATSTISQLLGIDAREVRRLGSTAPETDVSKAESTPDGMQPKVSEA
ncbi:hypothetical protein [Actinotalea sp. K2]|uniref:hypothetical protein n=1 Tax=Actinotalea sp. K2 TaxID=2939438 RepID=UPI002016B208|nr:hypothetical protein [Actinotalea sp. K2]MCL3862983.1 hypothetical protein [Actinotalea sp. K2]